MELGISRKADTIELTTIEAEEHVPHGRRLLRLVELQSAVKWLIHRTPSEMPPNG